MALTKVLITHINGVRHGVVIPDDDSQLQVHLDNAERMGESPLIASLEEYRSIGPDVLLQRHLAQ